MYIIRCPAIHTDGSLKKLPTGVDRDGRIGKSGRGNLVFPSGHREKTGIGKIFFALFTILSNNKAY